MSLSLPGSGSGPAPPALPAQPTPPPAFGATTPGSKPQAKANQPTFLGGQLAANPANTGQKSLLGT